MTGGLSTDFASLSRRSDSATLSSADFLRTWGGAVCAGESPQIDGVTPNVETGHRRHLRIAERTSNPQVRKTRRIEQAARTDRVFRDVAFEGTGPQKVRETTGNDAERLETTRG